MVNRIGSVRPLPTTETVPASLDVGQVDRDQLAPPQAQVVEQPHDRQVADADRRSPRGLGLGPLEHRPPARVTRPGGVSVGLGLGGGDLQGPVDPAQGPGQLDDAPQRRQPPADGGRLQAPRDEVCAVDRGDRVGLAGRPPRSASRRRHRCSWCRGRPRSRPGPGRRPAGSGVMPREEGGQEVDAGQGGRGRPGCGRSTRMISRDMRCVQGGPKKAVGRDTENRRRRGESIGGGVAPLHRDPLSVGRPAASRATGRWRRRRRRPGGGPSRSPQLAAVQRLRRWRRGGDVADLAGGELRDPGDLGDGRLAVGQGAADERVAVVAGGGVASAWHRRSYPSSEERIAPRSRRAAAIPSCRSARTACRTRSSPAAAASASRRTCRWCSGRGWCATWSGWSEELVYHRVLAGPRGGVGRLPRRAGGRGPGDAGGADRPLRRAAGHVPALPAAGVGAPRAGVADAPVRRGPEAPRAAAARAVRWLGGGRRGDGAEAGGQRPARPVRAAERGHAAAGGGVRDRANGFDICDVHGKTCF